MEPMRFGMYGKDFAEELRPTTFYRLSNTLDNFKGDFRCAHVGYEIKRGTFSPSYFKWMYEQVGKDYRWWYFLQKTDTELAEYLKDKYCYTLMYMSNPVGFAILEVESKGSINLSYFGLTPEALANDHKGIGTYFLGEMIEEARYLGSRDANFWVYTTNRDHPAALPVYRKVGFQLTRTYTDYEYIPLWTGVENESI